MDIQRLGRWQLGGLLRGCAIQLFATVAVLTITALCIVIFYLIPVPRSWEDLRFVLGLSSGVMLTVLLSWVVLLGVVLYRRQKLNQLFAAFHAKFNIRFLGQRFQSQFTVDGRSITVVLQRGPMLTITTNVKSQTRLSLRNTKAELPVRWEDLMVTASDPGWLSEWTAQGAVQSRILDLLSLQSKYEVRSLWLSPEMLWLQLYRFPLHTLTVTNVQSMVTAFVALAEAAKITPSTMKPETQSALDRFANSTITHPNKTAWLILVGIGIVLGVIAVPVGILVLLANLLSS